MEDIIVPSKSHLIIFAQLKSRDSRGVTHPANLSQGTQLLTKCANTQKRGASLLWIPRSVVTTTDQDEIPILLLNMTNATQHLRKMTVLTHAQLMSDCVSNVLELDENPLEMESLSCDVHSAPEDINPSCDAHSAPEDINP